MMTRQLRSLGAVGYLLAVFISRGSAALDRVMHPPEDGPQAVFRLASSPALPDWRNPAPGHFKIGQLATILLPNASVVPLVVKPEGSSKELKILMGMTQAPL